MILVPLLLVAIGALASDVFRGRMPQSKAFELVNNKLMHQQSDDSGGFGGMGGGRSSKESQPLTTEGVHDLLGRQPDLVEKKSGNINDEMEPIIVETYKYPGIIKSYSVVVTYLENTAGDKQPATALKYVRKE